MAELPGYTFRFTMSTRDVIDGILTRVSPHAREELLRNVEPALAQRDRQLEDALTKALTCVCGGH